MSAQYEILPPGGHETYATSIFSKIKTYLDSNPYGYVSKNTTYSLSASGESVVLTGSDNSSKSVSLGTQLLPNLPVWTAEPTDNVYLIRRDTGGANAYGQVKFSTVWNYIKRKADSIYVYTAGDNMTLSSNTFYATKRWNAVTQGLKWSRIILVSNTVGVEGNSGLLHVACTRGKTVCNSTFLINTSHSSYGQITELGANNYSKFKVRLVVNSNGDYYVEIYDTASSIASGKTQTWHCSFLSFQPATITAYTTFTDGTTIPSGYTAKGEMETVLGDSALAIRNITRSGTTFTATRQNGTTFTFTQQDNDHYAWSDITSKPTTISGYGITDAKIASGVITLGSNTITPLTASSTLDATKLSGTIPSSCYTDTKNTAGSTNTSSKIFLIGATSQAANPQTYSHDTAYVGTDGCLYSGGTKVLTAHQDISGKADKSATVSNIAWSSNKLTKTINGTTSDVVSASDILDNLTSSQVTTALGFTPTANTGTITSVKTTAGAHTTINVSSGAANFNVPTKTSHLTNDSGFVTTDTKVTQIATDASSNAEYEILFSETADNTTRTEGARKTSQFTFNPQTNQVTAGHFTAETSSPSGNKTANLLGYDIQLGGTSNTWDGTHTSLKDTIAYLNSHFAPSAHDHNYLVSAGTNTQSTSSTAYALGSFNVRFFSETGKIPHQPSQWGFLLTAATGTNSGENHQIFMEQSNGNLYHRGTNASSSSSPPAFKTILDSSNYTSYTRNSSGVIKVKSVNKTPTNAGTSLASPTPSIDSGYKFLCWLYVQSNGYIIGASYPGGATATNATWWFVNGYLANYALTFYYLEIKDTI